MKNSTIKYSSGAIRICALPLAILVAVSASAASNSWTEATDEVWKIDTNWTASLKEEKAEIFNALPNATAPTEITPPVVEIVTPTGMITISEANRLVLNDTNPATRTGESAVKAILACLGGEQSPAIASNQFGAGKVIGISEVNLTKIPENTFNQNTFSVRVDTDAKANVGHTFTGQLSGTSGTELTSFSGGSARSSQNAGISAFSNNNIASNSGGSRAVAPRTSRKYAVASFTEKLGANTSLTRNSHDSLLTDYGDNPVSATDQLDVTIEDVAANEVATTSGNVTGIAAYIAQNNLLKNEATRAGNNTDLANIGLPKQSGDNSNSITAPTGTSITTGYQEVPTTHFASTTTSLGSVAVAPQSSSPAPAVSGIPSTGNNASYYSPTSARSSSVAVNSTSSLAQFNTIQKTPTLRRALSFASPPSAGDKTLITFGTDGLLLKDNLGVALSAGNAAYGDGMAVQIGYYDGANTGNNFSGTWVPLTGQNAVNSAYLVTTIGDDSGSGGGTVGSFYSGTLDFIVGNSGKGNFPPTTTIPLSLRFYNAALIANATLYNTVSDDLWLWQTPGPASPMNPHFDMSLQDLGLEWQGGLSSAFKTTVATPEPTSALLLAVGAAGIFGRRRRRA